MLKLKMNMDIHRYIGLLIKDMKILYRSSLKKLKQIIQIFLKP